MKVMARFPVYASGNCDFVTKRSKIEEGDKVVMLDKDADTLPRGTLCLHSNTVRMIVAKLGWELMTEQTADELVLLRAELAVAREKLDAMTTAISLLTETPTA